MAVSVAFRLLPHTGHIISPIGPVKSLKRSVDKVSANYCRSASLSLLKNVHDWVTQPKNATISCTSNHWPQLNLERRLEAMLKLRGRGTFRSLHSSKSVRSCLPLPLCHHQQGSSQRSNTAGELVHKFWFGV